MTLDNKPVGATRAIDPLYDEPSSARYLDGDETPVSPRTPGFTEQDFRSSFSEPALPAPNRGSADPAPTGDLLCGQAFCREQYGLRPLNMLHWARTVTEDGGQSLAILGIYNDADCLCHADRISWPEPFVNPLSGSVH